jgi:cytochrome c556
MNESKGLHRRQFLKATSASFTAMALGAGTAHAILANPPGNRSADQKQILADLKIITKGRHVDDLADKAAAIANVVGDPRILELLTAHEQSEKKEEALVRQIQRRFKDVQGITYGQYPFQVDIDTKEGQKQLPASDPLFGQIEKAFIESHTLHYAIEGRIVAYAAKEPVDSNFLEDVASLLEQLEENGKLREYHNNFTKPAGPQR